MRPDPSIPLNRLPRDCVCVPKTATVLFWKAAALAPAPETVRSPIDPTKGAPGTLLQGVPLGLASVGGPAFVSNEASSAGVTPKMACSLSPMPGPAEPSYGAA